MSRCFIRQIDQNLKESHKVQASIKEIVLFFPTFLASLDQAAMADLKLQGETHGPLFALGHPSDKINTKLFNHRMNLTCISNSVFIRLLPSCSPSELLLLMIDYADES
jgi:hypothetical protein